MIKALYYRIKEHTIRPPIIDVRACVVITLVTQLC